MSYVTLILLSALALCLTQADLPRAPNCGGTTNNGNKHPWIVYLEHHIMPGYVSPTAYVVKGFLINEDTIVTTASNTDLSPYYRLQKVHFGDYAHLTEDRMAVSYEEDRFVLNITKHVSADLALVKFQPAITYSEHVRPICLPDRIEDTANYKFFNYLCTRYTYLHNQETHPSGHATQTNNVIRRWKKQDCNTYYQALGALLHAWQECFSETRTDTCTGNLGGPLIHVERGYTYASGVASRALTFYEVPANSPTVYVNFMENQGKLLNWIKNHTMSRIPPTPPSQ